MIDFVIMARTDAHAVEGQQAALDRAAAYVEAGADMIFAEALTTVEEYQQFTGGRQGSGAGKPHRVWQDAAVYDRRAGASGVRLALYPLVRFSGDGESGATMFTNDTGRWHTTSGRPEIMQTRTELYDVLGYHEYEAKARRAVCRVKG